MSYELSGSCGWLSIRAYVYCESHTASYSCTSGTNTTLSLSNHCHQVTELAIAHTLSCVHRSDQRGQFLAVASSTDHSVFLCSGLMSKGFMVLGHTGRLLSTCNHIHKWHMQLTDEVTRMQ